MTIEVKDTSTGTAVPRSTARSQPSTNPARLLPPPPPPPPLYPPPLQRMLHAAFTRRQRLRWTQQPPGPPPPSAPPDFLQQSPPAPPPLPPPLPSPPASLHPQGVGRTPREEPRRCPGDTKCYGRAGWGRGRHCRRRTKTIGAVMQANVR